MKELIKENNELKHQIKLFKQSSASYLISPQKSIESFNSKQPIEDSSIEDMFSVKKKVKKIKKKTKRRKMDYLNPNSVTKVRESIDIVVIAAVYRLKLQSKRHPKAGII